jgi:hypothetical protein
MSRSCFLELNFYRFPLRFVGYFKHSFAGKSKNSRNDIAWEGFRLRIEFLNYGIIVFS